MIDHDNLEEFSDPVSYDIEDSSDTGIAFYAALAHETGGSVLEIACGTGRVGIPIARQGLALTGLDIVPGMLEVARRKSVGLPARWIEGDARTFELSEEFKLVFLTGNAFQAFLTRTDQESLLERVHAHLGAAGLFAFETRNPRWARLAGPGKEEGWDTLAPLGKAKGQFAYLETRKDELYWDTFTDSAGRKVSISKTQEYDHVAQILHWTSYRRWLEGGEEKMRRTRIAVRFTFPQELGALLHYNRFGIIRQYGDWNLEPLTAGSPSIITVCRKLT